MIFSKGDILIVPFPFSNLYSVKKRPVVVLSEVGEDIIVCAITSNLRENKYSVLIDNSCLSEGKLPTKSLIKIGKLFTINKKIVIKKVGILNKNYFKKIRKEFLNLI